MRKRAISSKMMEALLSGTLQPMLAAVQQDDTLCMELRGDFVSIYCRGGSLFRIEELAGVYGRTFDTNYCGSDAKELPAHPTITQAAELLPYYKQVMDRWFCRHPKYEREFQQVLLRENNRLKNISRGTDYFIIDLEYADGPARFDMVAMKWPSTSADRRNLNRPLGAY